MSEHGMLLEKTIAATREAGEIVQAHWGKPRRITHKGRVDLVTETDMAVELALKDKLADILPGSRFLAEETASSSIIEEKTWIIDPLDGTTNFAHGLPFVGVSVGLWLGGEMALGVVYNPILDELFAGARGHGAFLNGKRISVSTAQALRESVIATGFPYAIEENLEEILRHMRRVLPRGRGLRRYGAASIDMAYVACGRLDGFYEIGLKAWDTAGGWPIIEEAGGVITQYDGSPYEPGARTILAANGHIHAELSEITRA